MIELFIFLVIAAVVFLVVVTYGFRMGKQHFLDKVISHMETHANFLARQSNLSPAELENIKMINYFINEFNRWKNE